MPNGAEEKTTIELIDIVSNCEHTLYTAACIELADRIIEENDADDSPQHRGGIRPYRAPIVP